MTAVKRNDGKRKPGRPPKSSGDSHRRVNKFLGLDDDSKVELLSVLGQLFCQAKTASEMREAVGTHFPAYSHLLHGENLWDLLREAAAIELFMHTPQQDFRLRSRLVKDHPWLEEHVDVAKTPVQEAIALLAARTLLRHIRQIRKHRNCQEVHVGFAGGATLRIVAQKLAWLLQEFHPENPKTIVFHAMVAGLDEYDFFADPNSFVTYFVDSQCSVEIRCIRLPTPGIIDSCDYEKLLSVASVRRVFDEAMKKLNCIVTSASLWNDRSRTKETVVRTCGNDEKSMREAIDSLNVCGDLLWQPINSSGPVLLDLPRRIATLVQLSDLPQFIEKGGTVLLVLGCSGLPPHEPKSEILKVLLKFPRMYFTDLVTDTPTLRGTLSDSPCGRKSTTLR